MAEKIPIMNEKLVTLEGYFNLKDTYNDLMSYVEDSLFYQDVTVKDYSEKNLDGSKEIVSKVESEKLYNDKYKIVLKYEINMNGKEVEVELKGKKLQLCKGTAKLKMNAYIQPDFGADPKESTGKKFLRDVYNKFVGNDEQSACTVQAGKDVGQIITRFKEHLNASIK